MYTVPRARHLTTPVLTCSSSDCIPHVTLVGPVQRLEKLVVVFLAFVADFRQQQLVLTIRRRLVFDVRLLACSQNLPVEMHGHINLRGGQITISHLLGEEITQPVR